MCSVGVGDEHLLTSLPLREGIAVLGLGKERGYLLYAVTKILGLGLTSGSRLAGSGI